METISKFYLRKNPQDPCGLEINEGATFGGLLDELRAGRSVYDYIGAQDSIVREAVFEELARITGVSYDYIYSLWIGVFNPAINKHKSPWNSLYQ